MINLPWWDDRSSDRAESPSTDSTTVSQRQSYVSEFSPFCAPWIFNNISIAGFSGQKYGVVNPFLITLIKDSAFIVSPVASHYRNGDGIWHNFFVKWAASSNRFVVWNLKWSRVHQAISLNCLVGIGTFSDDSVDCSVNDSHLRTASITAPIAPIVIWSAVEDLLFRETLEITVLCADTF